MSKPARSRTGQGWYERDWGEYNLVAQAHKRVISARVHLADQKDARYLATLGGRTHAWVMRQALKCLLRDLELGVVLLQDVKSPLDSRHDVVFTTIKLTAEWDAWIGRIQRYVGSRSEVVRYALRRYLDKRQPLLRGETDYVDSLFEHGPKLPPAP